MLLFNVIPDLRRSYVLIDALIEVSARIPDIVCIVQTTLVMVNNALLVNDRRLLFFRFDLVSDLTANLVPRVSHERPWERGCLTACIHVANINSNRPRSIYQYSNMFPRLSGQSSIFGVVFFVSKSLLGIKRQKKLEIFAILTRKPRSHARILIYRTWPILRPSSLSLPAHYQNNLRKLNANQNAFFDEISEHARLLRHANHVRATCLLEAWLSRTRTT